MIYPLTLCLVLLYLIFGWMSLNVWRNMHVYDGIKTIKLFFLWPYYLIKGLFL